MSQLSVLVQAFQAMIPMLIGLAVSILGWTVGTRALRSSGIEAYVPALDDSDEPNRTLSPGEYEWIGANIGPSEAEKWERLRQWNSFEALSDAWERKVI